MIDETESYRRARQAELNAAQAAREALEARYGEVWNTDELGATFEVLGFLAPLVVVRRLADGRKGSLEFQHGPPRYYFRFVPDRR